MLRLAAVHLEDPALATLRRPQPAPRIHGWLDGWSLGWAWFDWEDARVWGWDSVLPGERAVLRLVPERRGAVALMANSNTGRALYRSLFPELLQSLFEISVPPLRLARIPTPPVTYRDSPASTRGPTGALKLSATETSLLIKSEDGETEASAARRANVRRRRDGPDNPSVTFGAFETAGRPRILYEMLWGLPRLDE